MYNNERRENEWMAGEKCTKRDKFKARQTDKDLQQLNDAFILSIKLRLKCPEDTKEGRWRDGRKDERIRKLMEGQTDWEKDKFA